MAPSMIIHESFAMRALVALTMLAIGTSAFSTRPSSSVLPATRSSSSRLFVASSSATMLPEGLVKTVVQPGRPGSDPIGRGDLVTLKYTVYATDDANDKNILLSKSEKQKVKVGEGTMVRGWDAALCSMTNGERSIVRITDSEGLGYGTGSKGAQALELLGGDPSSCQLELDLDVLGVVPAALAKDAYDMSFDVMLEANTIPRTAAEIDEAYRIKMANKPPEKEGFEGWLEEIKGYYFFGLFEGETGQEAPWYLKPSITFPLAFAVVGAAFYVSLLGGAIYEKGAQSVDELDVIKGVVGALWMPPSSGGGL